VFLDSPLAIAVTEIYKAYPEYMKTAVQQQIQNGDDIFHFEGLSFTRTPKDSHEIQLEKGAKIIIAGSGMSHGGRIRMHERNYLGEKNTTVLLVGYQSVGSLGRLLQDGATKVRIDGEDVKVKAQIATIRGFSGHADRDQLVNIVAHGGDQAQQVFVTMGEEKSSLFLVQRLRDYLGLKAIAPSEGQEIEIDF
jgi:metallo-beta-lactamase family protein